MRIAVIIAMDKEYEAVCRVLGAAEGVLGSNNVCVLKGGIGKVNAAVIAQKAILSSHPDCILSTGCAGGLRPDVYVMDVVAAGETCYHDVWCGEPNAPGQVQGMPERFSADAAIYAKAKALEGVRGGLICTGDRFCTERAEVEAIAAAFPDALAVDMESAAIAQVCHIHKVPFLSMRVISDSVAAEDRKGEYKDFWAGVSERSFEVLRRLLEVL